jgi:hypothetical protein
MWPWLYNGRTRSWVGRSQVPGSSVLGIKSVQGQSCKPDINLTYGNGGNRGREGDVRHCSELQHGEYQKRLRCVPVLHTCITQAKRLVGAGWTELVCKNLHA